MEPLNPVKATRHRLHLSQVGLASQAGISVNTLAYVEKGMYQNIPEGIVSVLLDYCPTIISDYKTWVKAKRRSVAAPFNLTPPYPTFHSHEQFRSLILHMSLNQYCANMCVERKAVFTYERSQTRVPKRIMQAIKEAFGEDFSEHFYKVLTPDWIRQ